MYASMFRRFVWPSPRSHATRFFLTRLVRPSPRSSRARVSTHFCRLYGMFMMVFAFTVGLTAVLNGLETPVLDAAAASVPRDVRLLTPLPLRRPPAAAGA